MKLDQISICEEPEEYESLVLCLRAVARTVSVDLSYDDLCAALGVSFSAVSTVSESSPGWWTTFGRDAFVEATARLFGFELRDLHPPDVAIDMLAADEFTQHFELSYKPLIRRALENAQPVLAWQGWPGHLWPFWGVITAESGESFEGRTMWSEGEPQRLEQPALQCYVVEECDPQFPDRTRLLAMAMRHAHAYLNCAPFTPVAPGAPRPGLITGPAAFDAWEEWLGGETAGSSGPAWNDHRQHAEFIAASRSSAARFLRSMLAGCPDNALEDVEGALACCESLAARLAESRDPAIAEELFRTSRGRAQILESVHAAEADDRRLAMHVERLNTALAQTPQ